MSCGSTTAFFNVWNLKGPQRAILERLGADKMPYNTRYGDGSPVPDEVLAELHHAYEMERASFGWRAGDVLVVDNMLVAHGRASFSGTRKVMVGMTDPFRCEEFAGAAPWLSVSSTAATRADGPRRL